MMLRSNAPRASAAICVLLTFLINVADCADQSWSKCSGICIAQNCDSIGIRYGKYCGLGHTGCPGEKPCDDVDACCMKHDDCVGKYGMTHVKCHEKFKNCLRKVLKSGKAGFSKECPYSIAAPTMIRGMDVAITLSQMGQSTMDL
ncbi:hypothetical protein QN277_000829 [Acacia crassicarpa]|uniref:phospholipase A2 n=2 Tax=Acacia crassicarpa TaxID=499986 RepID=A0AAE1N661_9FABA|nr:hypothetical protein QN277_000829 [Acacia crassicarpa]